MVGLRSTPSWLRAGLVALGLAAGVFVLYGRVWGHEFVSLDDPKYILDNPYVREGLSWEGLRWALSGWHPLTWLSHMLDCEWFGLHAGSHHLVSVGLHAANALLLFAALRCLTGAFGRSAIVAAIFAVHPLRVESVAWAAERKDVLSGLFWMLTLLAYVRYARSPGPARYVLVAVALALGLLSKSMLVSLPIVLLLLDFWPLGRGRDEGARKAGRGPVALVVEKLPLLALAALAAIHTLRVQAGAGAVRALGSLPLGERLANGLTAYGTYLWKTVWPVDLAVFYPHPSAVSSGLSSGEAGRAAGWALVLAGITAFAVVQRRCRPYLLVGWLWFLVSLLPVIGLVQVGEQAWADRYVYLPLIGIYVAVVWALADLARGRRWLARALAVALPAMLLVLGVATWRQVGTWRTSRTLFEHALRVTDDNYLAHHNLGLWYAGAGELERAIGHHREAVRILPGYAEAHNNLGVLYQERGLLDLAVEAHGAALRARPELASAHHNLGLALLRRGEPAAARERFERALALDPDLVEPHRALSGLLAEEGDRSEAVRHLEALLRIRPDDADAHHRLGLLQARQGDLEAARRSFEAAIRYRSDFADAHNNLGIVHARDGDFEAAVRAFRAALRLRPDYEEARSNLERALRMREP